MTHEESDIKRLKEGAWVIVWRWGVVLLGTLLSAFSLYATMWIKVNAPTRTEFSELLKTVQSLREDIIRAENQKGMLDNHEKRIFRLEDEERRRFPVRGTP